MTATAHTLVAGAIAAKIGNPVLAPTLAFASHFILDSIPHWDFGANWRMRSKLDTGVFAIIDTIVGFGLAYLIYGSKTNFLLLTVCLVLSVLPDWLEAPWYIFFADPKRVGPRPHASFMEKVCYSFYKLTNRAHSKASYPWGVVSQILTVTFFLLLLK
jgi:hypothetical protein